MQAITRNFSTQQVNNKKSDERIDKQTKRKTDRWDAKKQTKMQAGERKKERWSTDKSYLQN